MKREFFRLAGGLALAAALVSAAPCAVFAVGEEATIQPGGTSEIAPQAEEPVAMVGETPYTDIDTAVEEAPEGSTITLLGDCEMTKGFNKTLTFTGNGKITINKQLTSNGEGWMCFGLYDPSRVLTFDGSGVSVEWNSDGSAPWLMLSLSGTLNVTNGASLTFKFDSRTTGTRNAIYMNAGSELNVTKGSTFQVLGVGTESNAGQGIQLDQTGTADINVTDNSTFLIDGTNRGYVNSPAIYVEDSTFSVQNCTSNGSNGGEFTTINSKITYENNNGHGLSAGNVTIKNSTLDCNNNAYYGFTYSGNMTMDGTSSINANGNGYGYTGGGLRAYGTSTVESGATINILNNQRNGMENYGSFTMKDGVHFTATGNREPSTNGGAIYNGATLVLPSNAVITGNYAEQTGGGICNAGTVSIPEGVTGIQLYNNHAGDAGDDIFNRDSAKIEGLFTTGEWKLDGVRISKFESVGAKPTTEPFGCTDTIDGWYVDSADARWEAHADSYDGIHVEKYTFNGTTTTVTGSLALKAAHGLGVVAVDPADITIYMGGDDGYEGTSTANGAIEGSNSLPEPGFYFILSDDINQAFADAGIAELDEAADLSQYMTIYTHDYNGENGELHWKLEKYGENNSEAYNRFIYRIVPVPTAGQGAVPVRLQFTGEDGSTVTSDEFDPSAAGTLSQKYTMQLYTELVQNDQVVFEVDIKGQKFYNSMELQTGELNVRYVTGDQDDVVSDVVNSEAELAAAKAEDPDKAFALHPEGTIYYINDSQVDIADGIAPSLLFDDVVSDHNTAGADEYDQQLASRAVDVVSAQGTALENPWFQAKYLDLVDANNGNVWLTASEPTTVYWPYPEGTDENTEFHLVHFAGLDRTMQNGAIDGAIDSAATEYVAVENTEHGIRFTTNGFSPFVLMWDAGADAGTQPEPPAAPSEPSTGLPTTGDYSLMGAAVAAVAGIAVVGCGIYMAKKQH